MTFEQWWILNQEEIESNCENRMDIYDAEYWLEKAFNAGSKNDNQISRSIR